MAEEKIQESPMVAASPFDFHPLFAAEFVGVEKLSMPCAVFMHKLGHLDIKATVFGDLYKPFFSPPLDGVNTVRRFAHAESRLGDVLQPGLTSCHFFNFHQEIQGSQLKRQIEDGVTH